MDDNIRYSFIIFTYNLANQLLARCLIVQVVYILCIYPGKGIFVASYNNGRKKSKSYKLFRDITRKIWQKRDTKCISSDLYADHKLWLKMTHVRKPQVIAL